MIKKSSVAKSRNRNGGRCGQEKQSKPTISSDQLLVRGKKRKTSILEGLSAWEHNFEHYRPKEEEVEN